MVMAVGGKKLKLSCKGKNEWGVKEEWGNFMKNRVLHLLLVRVYVIQLCKGGGGGGGGEIINIFPWNTNKTKLILKGNEKF